VEDAGRSSLERQSVRRQTSHLHHLHDLTVKTVAHGVRRFTAGSIETAAHPEETQGCETWTSGARRPR
jgi:hypothetical protein